MAGVLLYSLTCVLTDLLTCARPYTLIHRAASAHESMRPMIEATVTVASKQFHRSCTSYIRTWSSAWVSYECREELGKFVREAVARE